MRARVCLSIMDMVMVPDANVSCVRVCFDVNVCVHALSRLWSLMTIFHHPSLSSFIQTHQTVSVSFNVSPQSHIIACVHSLSMMCMTVTQNKELP